MRKTIMLIAAVALIGGVLLRPEDVVGGVQGALGIWYAYVLPVLFPFFIGTSLLIRCGAMDNLPKGALPMVTGAIAGSPAGIRCAMEINAPVRTALMSLGMSAAFITATIGASIMRSPPVGLLILACELIALWICGALPASVYGVHSSRSAAPIPRADDGGVMSSAVRAMLQIAGWMAAFAAIAAAITPLLPDIPLLRAALCGILEVAGGAVRIAELPLYRAERIMLLTACVSFGGLSIIMQSMHYARACGIRLLSLIMFKAAHAIVATALAALALRFVDITAFAPSVRLGGDLFATLTVWALYALSLLTALLVLSRKKT